MLIKNYICMEICKPLPSRCRNFFKQHNYTIITTSETRKENKTSENITQHDYIIFYIKFQKQGRNQISKSIIDKPRRSQTQKVKYTENTSPKNTLTVVISLKKGERSKTASDLM